MAVDMQQRMTELNAQWRRRGIEVPFQIRMGINSGYCNVGNFGSADRMDYTIIGAEANLAARLEQIAETGGIVMSYETYALVRDIVISHQLPPIRIKGISREIVPYAVEGLVAETADGEDVINEHAAGMDFFLDIGKLDEREVERVRHLLGRAITMIETRGA
jgi:class 3 adenylate cyclase